MEYLNSLQNQAVHRELRGWEAQNVNLPEISPLNLAQHKTQESSNDLITVKNILVLKLHRTHGDIRGHFFQRSVKSDKRLQNSIEFSREQLARHQR